MPRLTLRDLPTDQILIAPSILSADFAELGRDLRAMEAGGADVVHIDVMDGHFVPNLSMGPALVQCLRPLTDLPFDVHLMVSRPSDFIAPFRRAGADHMTIHVEADDDIAGVLRGIRDLGCSAGLSVKPGTPASALDPYLELLDLILIMTVEPGFSGQAFRRDVLPKMHEIRARADAAAQPIHVEVDGGVAPDTVPDCVAHGCNLLAAASAVFKGGDVAGNMARLRAAAAS
jgi:ribulose-phosphate 3-epimerase